MPALDQHQPDLALRAGLTGRRLDAGQRPDASPFCGLIDAVLVDGPLEFQFDGSLDRAHAEAIWSWFARDVASGALDVAAGPDTSSPAEVLEAQLPHLLITLRDVLASAAANEEQGRRLRVVLGGAVVHDRLPVVMEALKHRALLPKAGAFGRAAGSIPDEAGLVVALQSMPLHDGATTALLMHAAVGQSTNPSKLVLAAIKMAGVATEPALMRVGMGPLIEAILAHAQSQIAAMQTFGPFADVDKACRAIERFHRLVRAIGSLLELPRGSRWSAILGALTKRAADTVEQRLRNIVPDINLAMRRGREGADRVDGDQMLAALNGVYLLATLRDCKDSLALNAAFEQAWSQSGQALELHLNRNLDLLRANPVDRIAEARLDAGIKMAEVRFNPDYAETLRRAKATAQRR